MKRKTAGTLGEKQAACGTDKKRKGEAILRLRLVFISWASDQLFLNFFPKPARPSRPSPRRSMVAGSGTGARYDSIEYSTPSSFAVNIYVSSVFAHAAVSASSVPWVFTPYAPHHAMAAVSITPPL